MEEIKEELSKCGEMPCSWIGRLSIVKMSILPNLIYKFKALPVRIPASYFVDIGKLILKFIWRGKRCRIASTTSKEKSKFGRLTLPNFKTYYKVTVIKTVW